MADRPTSTGWDIAGVSVHQDPNHDVGGTKIMRPDTSYGGNGYEEVVFSIDVLDDPDAAWARVNTGTSPSVTIAFKKSLVAGTRTFVWGVWAADSLLDPALIDLHDNFTQNEAGSPYSSHSTYPLAALNLVDNTCRETYKFEATMPIPVLCYTPDKPTPTPTPTATPTEEPLTGTITGVVYNDTNNNGNRDSGEALNTTSSFYISLHSGPCNSPPIQTTSAYPFNFSGLVAGSYCVKINTFFNVNPPSSHPSISMPEGGSIYVEFGFEIVN